MMNSVRIARRLVVSVILLLSVCCGSALADTAFSDGFEGPTINSWWTIVAAAGSGSVNLSTAFAHTGTQSAQVNTTSVDGIQDLRHSFTSPLYGVVSVWVYYSNTASTGYKQLDIIQGTGSTGRDYLIYIDWGNLQTLVRDSSGATSQVAPVQSTGWHQWTFASTPSSVTIQIDGATVFTQQVGFQFNTINLQQCCQAGSSFFDDFSFTPAFYLPQIADGQGGGVGWATTVAITNPAAPGTSTASVTMTFTKSDGTPLNMALTDLQGQPVALSAGTISFQILGGQTKLYISRGVSPGITTGYATITSNVPVAGVAVFNEFTATRRIAAAGVAAASLLTQQATFVSKNNNDTGLALANPGPTAATVTFQLLDMTGAPVLSSVIRTVAAKNHTAFFVSQLFPNLQNGFFGTLRITSSEPLAAIALLFESDATFATLPVIPLP